MRRLLAVLLLLAPGASGAENLDTRLTTTAASLRGALPEDARAEALFPFEDDEREDIRFAPLLLEGARHGAMAEQPASLTEQLLAISLSPRGLETARLIRRNERIVAKQDAAGWVPRFVVDRMRDPGRYFLALFGEPSGATPWAFRYEGHHLSLNVTVAPGKLPATTPLFLGAQPRVVPAGEPDAGAAVLGEEEAAARALLAALPGAPRARATLPYAGDRSLMLGQVRRVSLSGNTGVARGEMSPEARAQLDLLIERFTGLFAPEIAAARRAELDAAGRDALRFAWAEAAETPGLFYFRIQGPRTLIEIDNTTDGDHLHAVWHDVPGDFGADLLAAHYRLEHGIALRSEP